MHTALFSLFACKTRRLRAQAQVELAALLCSFVFFLVVHSLKAEAGQEVQNCGNNELAARGHAICRQDEHIYQSSSL